jgi:GNAT superfamily N-acetyltransferase
MSQEIIIPFDETILRLPSCLAIHSQLRPSLNQFTSKDYVDLMQKLCQTGQSHLCGIIRKNQSETIVLALAFYRIHPTTYDTIRFEIYDLIVDEKERNHGLGTHLFQHLINQAKQCGAPALILQCDLTNTNAHRFFFRHNLTISSFGFCFNRGQLSENNNQINVIDITDLPENENEELLIKAQDVFRQLRPHLSSDQKVFINQIRNICQTGPARMLIARNNDEQKDILGLAIYRISHNIKYSKHIYCDDLATDENKRSLGVGRALINYMKNKAQNLGLDRIALDSGCQRGRPHKFYHREGFHIDQFKFTLLF